MKSWDSTTQRIRVPLPTAPRSPWRIVAFTGLAAAVAAGALYANHFLTETDLVSVQSLRVTGVEPTVAREIEAYAAVKIGTPLFSVNTDSVAASVSTHPFVRHAAVRRIPPDTVSIDVTPRAAVATVALTSLYLLDEDGTIFKRAAAGDGLDLPVFTGVPEDRMLDTTQDAPLQIGLRAMAAFQAAGRPGGALASVHLGHPSGVTLFLETGTEVRLGVQDFERRLETLNLVLTRLKARKERPEIVYLTDARRPERVAVRLAARSEMTSQL